jgi:hypothetical protein
MKKVCSRVLRCGLLIFALSSALIGAQRVSATRVHSESGPLQATATRTPTPINVGNFVWNDLDADGRQDAGEPGLPGVSVQLWNSTKTLLIASSTTNANGNYTLIAPTPGNYRVRVILPAFGDQFTLKDAAAAGDLQDSDINPDGANLGFTDVYSFASNLISITSIDAGIRKFATATPTRTPTPVNIGNLVWADNGNGIQDAGEPGLANVTVQLWNSAANQLIDTATTNANGNYTLVAPGAGDYRVRVLLGIGTAYAPQDATPNELIDSDCFNTGPSTGFTDVISIAANVISVTSWDCGLTGPYSTATPTPPASATPTLTPSPIATETPTLTPSPIATETPTLEPAGTETVIVPVPEGVTYLPLTLR